MQQRVADNRRVKQSVVDQSFVESSFQADNIALRNRIDELLSIQREERMRFECAEETIEELKNRCDEFDIYTRVRDKSSIYLNLKIEIFEPIFHLME